jgi:O-glycosyl hydrolase
VNQSGCPVSTAPTPTPTPTPAPTPPPANGTITVNPAQRFQTINGWEGAVLASIQDYQLVESSLPTLIPMVVDLGFTRARLAVRNGLEGAGAASFSPVNDNADPNVLDLSKFDFSALDYQVTRFIQPLRQAASARGESFYVGLQYVDHEPNTSFEHSGAEYAEFMLAVFKHMRDTFGFVPNGIDVVNEPDNFSDWNPTRIGQAIVATAQKLQANGFGVPEFITPSTANTTNAFHWFDQIIAMPGVAGLVKELSYHRYGGPGVSDLQAIAQRGQQYNVRTSQLEFWGDFVTPNSGANYLNLYEDLTLANVSAWQQGVFADFNNCVSQIVRRQNGGEPCPNTRLIAQYTKYVRAGAQRIGASSQNQTLAPLAFINADGKYVVVVKTDGAASFSVGGLPAGTYGISSTLADGTQATGADVTIAAGQAVQTSIAGVGVITVYRR